MSASCKIAQAPHDLIGTAQPSIFQHILNNPNFLVESIKFDSDALG
jgi:hypothetical protein